MVEHKRRSSDNWDGEERRSCLQHSAHTVLLKDNADKIKALEDLKPIPFSTFKWAIGLVIGLTFSLFSMSLVSSEDAKRALHDIQVTQAELVLKVESIQEDISHIKLSQREDQKEISRQLKIRADILNKVMNKLEDE